MNEYDYLEKASKEMDDEQFSKVIALCDKALKINSKLPDAYRFRGNAKYELGQYASALKDQSDAIGLEPDEAVHYQDRAWTYTKLDKFDDAILDINKAIELKPDIPEFYIDKGIFEYGMDRYKESIQSFSKGIAMKPTAYGYFFRGDAYADFGADNLALADYNKTIELAPEHYRAYYARGVLKRKMDMPEAALEDLKKALELFPDSCGILQEIGILKIELNHKDAMGYYERAIKVNPCAENYIAKINARQKIYARQYIIETLSAGKYLDDNRDAYYIYNDKQAKEDIADLNKIIKLTSDDVIAYEKRAERYTYLGKYKNAVKDYNFLIKIHSKKQQYYSQRAFCLECLELHEKALRDCEKSVELNDGATDLIVLETRGMANYKLGNYQKALNNFNLALDIDEDCEICYYRGLTNYKLKNYLQSCKDFKRAAKIQPNIEAVHDEKIPILLKLFV